MNGTETTRLRSGRIQVALHSWPARDGLALLALHPLGGSHTAFADAASAWPGPVHALDFSGHGSSDRPHGRAYAAEGWVSDADAALREVGPCAVVGLGVGAYVALMLAAARPERALATLLAPGRGLDGSGEHPDEHRVSEDRAALADLLRKAVRPSDAVPDPMVFETDMHHRPADYARRFANDAQGLVVADDDAPKPAWWTAVAGVAAVMHVEGAWRDQLPRLLATANARRG